MRGLTASQKQGEERSVWNNTGETGGQKLGENVSWHTVGEERTDSKEEGNPTNCWRKGSDRIQGRRWSDTLLGRRGPEKCTRASALTFCRKFWHVLIKQVLFWREQMWQAKNYATNRLPQGLTFTDRYLHYTENSCMVHVCELHTQHETWNKNLQEFCT